MRNTVARAFTRRPFPKRGADLAPEWGKGDMLTMIDARKAGRIPALGILLFFVAALVPCRAQVTETTLYTFSASSGNIEGIYPVGLIQGTDGNFYGTTNFGGAYNDGTVFSLTPAGAITVLHTFSGIGGDGATPNAGLVQAPDGNFYGTTTYGGANNYGTVYQITPGGTYTTLYSFSYSGAEGFFPSSKLIVGSDGNLYGSTYEDSITDGGSVFQITTSGVLTIIHTFVYGTGDGVGPYYGVIQGTDGNFYGTTTAGGPNYNGTVYQLTPGGTLTTLYSFSAIDNQTGTNTDGAQPFAGLLQASDGNLYGTTHSGGSGRDGTIYRLATDGSGFTVVYTFQSSDYAQSVTNLIQASDGNLYGNTVGGGPNFTGTVYKLTLAGAFSFIYFFGPQSNGINSDGEDIYTPIIQGSDGNLYGAAYRGGANGTGTIFSLNLSPAAPVISSLSPNTVDACGPDFTLTVNGSGFASGDTVDWNGTPLTTTFVNAGQLTVTVPAADTASPGTASVTVVTPGNAASNAATFTIGNPLPAISGLSPSSTSAAGPAFTLTVNGSCFLSSSTVNWNGVPLTTTFVNAGQLTASVPASDIANTGTASVTVVTPGPGGGTSNSSTFTITAAVPAITSLNPNSVRACGPAFTLTVNGSGFLSGAKVVWNGTPLTTTYVSAFQLTAAVPAGLIASPSTATIVVSDPNGNTSSGVSFAITNPLPVLSTISPTSVYAGGPDLTLTVKGKCFLFNSVVKWNNTPLTTTYVSATKLTATVPATLTASPGTASVIVLTPGPGGGASAAKTFKILGTALKLTTASLSRDPVTGVITGVLTIKNLGFQTASNVNVTASTLGAAKTKTALPVNLGAIAGGASASVTLTYPGSAGPTGAKVALKVSGLFTGGKFNSSLTVTLP